MSSTDAVIDRTGRGLVQTHLASRGLVAGIAILLAIGIAVLIYATRFGAWMFSDSVEYIVSARNLLKGIGVGLQLPSGEFQPIYLHPPFYPIALAFFGALGIELATIARWLNVVLFALSVLLAIAILYYATDSTWLALGAGVLFVLNPALVWISAGAMSEPLFIVLVLASILLLLKYLESTDLRLLLIAGVMTGLASLTRYPGIALIPAGVLGIAAFGPVGWQRRLGVCALFALSATAPIALYLVWVSNQPTVDFFSQSGTALGNLWQELTQLRIGLVNGIWSWIPFHDRLPALSYRPKPRLILTAAVIVGTVVILAVRKLHRSAGRDWRQNRSLQLIAILLAFTIASVGFLAVSYAFSSLELDAANIDERLLLPLQLTFVLSMLAAANIFLRAWPAHRWIAVPVLVLVGLAIAFYLPRALERITDLHSNPTGLASWNGSATLREVERLPADLPVITNESALILYNLDRPAFDLPELIGVVSEEPYTRLGDGNSDVDRVFRERGAALVLFYNVPDQLYWIYFEDTEERLAALTAGLHVHSTGGDGTIYFYKEPES